MYEYTLSPMLCIAIEPALITVHSGLLGISSPLLSQFPFKESIFSSDVFYVTVSQISRDLMQPAVPNENIALQSESLGSGVLVCLTWHLITPVSSLTDCT